MEGKVCGFWDINRFPLLQDGTNTQLLTMQIRMNGVLGELTDTYETETKESDE